MHVESLLPSALWNSSCTSDVFDATVLTLFGVLVGCQMPKRAVRSTLTVIDAPGFDLGLFISERRELVNVHTLVAQPAVTHYAVTCSSITGQGRRQ